MGGVTILRGLANLRYSNPGIGNGSRALNIAIVNNAGILCYES